MTVASMIAAGRVKVEDTFIDECLFVRPSTGVRSFDPVSMVSTPPAAVDVYSGRCRVKKPTALQEVEVFGDVQVTVQRRLINLPFDVPEVRVGDVGSVTSSVDGEVLRQSLRVVAVGSTSVLMFRQVGVEVVEG